MATIFNSLFKLGNCIAADGGLLDSFRANITITNNTKHELTLDTKERCGRKCNHGGWQISEGKIIIGAEPPRIIPPYSTGKFSVANRPEGKVFYANGKENLKVIFQWNNAGWTSPSGSTASITIVGIAQKNGTNIGGSDPKPWNQKLMGASNPHSWIYELRSVEAEEPPHSPQLTVH